MAGTSRRSDDDDDSSGDGGGGGVGNDHSKSIGHHRNHLLVNGNEPSYARPHSPVAKTLIRTDLISAMKLPDSEPLTADDYWIITDTWKPEWERGVEVPYNTKLAEAYVSKIKNPPHSTDRFTFPKKLLCMNRRGVYTSDTHQVTTAALRSEQMCNYDLDDLDSRWLNIVNGERALMGCTRISELEMERTMEELEKQSWDRINTALKVNEAQEEQDDSVICDVCRSPDSEECNEMVFCDKCNICVHQACYGITNIPSGSWLCKTCSLGIKPKCELCPNRGGAMKATKSGQKWAHVSCALWIPEVSIGCVEKMEPITKISKIPPSRWNLVCVLCKERVGSCIQCSVKTCKVAYHVTCAFKRGLEMRAIIEDENADDGVKLRSYCQRHSLNQKRNKDSEDSDEDTKGKKKHMTAEERSLARRQKIIKIESEFFKDVDLNHVSRKVGLELEVVSFINRYWILKRRSGGNRPLLLPRLDDPELSAVGDQDNEREKLKKFVALRQDLERVRNLCYMVSRREKLQRSFVKHREQILEKQLSLLADENCAQSLSLMELSSILEANHGASVYDRLYSHSEAEVHTENDFEIILARISGEISESSAQPRRESNRKFSTTSTSENQKPFAYKRIFSDSSASETDDIFSMSASMPRKDKKHGSPASGTTTTAAVAAAAAAAVNKKKLVGKGARGKSKKTTTITPKAASQSRKKLSDNSDSESSSDIEKSLTKKIGSDKRTSGVFSDSDSDVGSRVSPRQKSPVVRTKAAMKDFSVEDFQRARKANDKASKPKTVQRKKSSSPSKSRKKSPVFADSSPESESENDSTKTSKKKTDSDFYPMIVPERAAARRATAKLKDKPSTEGPDSKPSNSEDALRKGSAKYKKVKAPVTRGSDLSSSSSDEEEVDTKKRKQFKKNASETDDAYGYVPQRKAAKKASAQMKDVDRSVSKKEENLLFGDLISNKPQPPQKKSGKKKSDSVLPPLSQRLHSDTDSDEEPFRQRSPRGHKSPRGRAVVPRSPRKPAKKALQQSQPPVKKGLSEKAMSFLKGRETQLDDIFKECGFGGKSSTPEQPEKPKITDATQVIERPPTPVIQGIPEVKPSKQSGSSSSCSNSSSSSSSSGSSSSDSDSENRVASSRRRTSGISQQQSAPTSADLLSKTGRASSSDKLQTVKSKLEEKSSIKIEEEVKENQAPVEKIRTPGRDGKYLSSQVSPLLKSPPLRSPSLASPGLNSSASSALGTNLPISSPQVKSVRSTPSHSQLMSPNFVEQSPRKAPASVASSLKSPTGHFPTKSPGRQMLNDSTNDLAMIDRLGGVESDSEKSTSPIPGLSKAPTVQETLELVKTLQRDFAEQFKGTLPDPSTTTVPQISPCMGSEGGLDKQRPAKQTDEGYVSSEIANTEQGIEFAKLPAESPSISTRPLGKEQPLPHQHHTQQNQHHQYMQQHNQQIYNQEFNQHVSDPNWHLQQNQSQEGANQEGLLDLYRKFSAGYTGTNPAMTTPYDMGIQSQLKQWQTSSQYDMIYQQSQYNNYLHLQQLQHPEYQKQFLEQLMQSYNQSGSMYNLQRQQFGKNDVGHKLHKSPSASSATGHSKYHPHQLQHQIHSQSQQHGHHSQHSRGASSPQSAHDERMDLHRTHQNKVQSASQHNQTRPSPLNSENRYSQSQSDHQRQHFSPRAQGSSDKNKYPPQHTQHPSKESPQKPSGDSRYSFQLEQAERSKDQLQQKRNHLAQQLQMLQGDPQSSIPSATPVERLPGFVGNKESKLTISKESGDSAWRADAHRELNRSPLKALKSPEKSDSASNVTQENSSPSSRSLRRTPSAPVNDKSFDDLIRKTSSSSIPKGSEAHRGDLGFGRTPTNSESHDQSVSDIEKSDYDETNNKGGVDYDDFFEDEDFVPPGKTAQPRPSVTLKVPTSGSRGRGKGSGSQRNASAKNRGRSKSKAVTINTKALAQVKKSVAGTDYDFEDEFGDDFGDQDKPEVVSLQELREQSKKQYLPVYMKDQTETSTHNSKSVFQDFSDEEENFASFGGNARGRGKRSSRGRGGIGRGAGRASKISGESLDIRNTARPATSAKVQPPSETGKLKLTLNIGALMNRKDKSTSKKRSSSKENEIKVPKITIKLGPKPEQSKIDSVASNAGYNSTRDRDDGLDMISRPEDTEVRGGSLLEDSGNVSSHKKAEDDSWYQPNAAEKKKQSPVVIDQYPSLKDIVEDGDHTGDSKRSPLIDPTSPSKRRQGSKLAKTPPEIESVFGPSVPLDMNFPQPNLPTGHNSPAGFVANMPQPLDRGDHRPSSVMPAPEANQDKSELELIQEEINLMDHKSGASPHAHNVQGPLRKALNAVRNAGNMENNFDEDDGLNRRQHLKMKFKVDEKHTSQTDQTSYGSSASANLLSNPYNSSSMMLMGGTLAGGSASGSVNNIRRMRKKELLNQYYGGQEYSTAPVNGPSSVSSVTSMLSAIANEPIQAMQQQQPVRNIIKMPKAVASVTSVPTRADYQSQLEANLERKRKRDKGLTDASKPFEMGANKFQEKSGKKKKGRGKQNDEDIEYKPKTILEASQEEEKKENARKTRGKPPKKCLAESPPHDEMTAGDLKAENMKYAEQIRAQFDKDPGQSGSGGNRGKQRKRRRDDDGVAITNAKAPRIVIKFSKGPQEDPLVTEHRDHLSVENLSTGRNGLDEYDFDGYSSQKVTPLPIVDGTADHYSSVNSSPAPNDVATKVPKLKIKMQKV